MNVERHVTSAVSLTKRKEKRKNEIRKREREKSECREHVTSADSLTKRPLMSHRESCSTSTHWILFNLTRRTFVTHLPTNDLAPIIKKRIFMVLLTH